MTDAFGAASAFLASIVATTLLAQDPTATPSKQQALSDPAAQQPNGIEYSIENAGSAGSETDDYFETHMQGGFRVRIPQLGLQLRGSNLLILNDL